MFILLLLNQILSKSIPLSPPSSKITQSLNCTGPYCEMYIKSLEVAKTPVPSRIFRALTPINRSNSKLIFDDQGLVLMVSAGLSKYFPNITNSTFELPIETWFTAYPDLKASCKQYSVQNKTLRMLQQLGLPPIEPINAIVEVFVNLTDLFRPCPDPEIFDSECLLEVPVINVRSNNSEAPWFCPENGQEFVQVASRWVNVNTEHFIWMCNNWRGSYNSTEAYMNYPWTGLGYTYDWATQLGYGLSEFVVGKGSIVKFKARYNIEEYCALS
ncbi:hypothetical protein SteCoe_32509 [Stentor coeruleus]|uniref:Uncharacterized protein n=1 Tax=Stentor coeruleus TaxID=5963 RepID=A0A1R2AYV0_9CILI|nr:hypothetical protein SteCoe_32509 [Stentor coeruleus]